MERQPSCGEIVMLSDMFEKQGDEKGIKWTDMDIKNEAYMDFFAQWIAGDNNPQILLCGYGYELSKAKRDKDGKEVSEVPL